MPSLEWAAFCEYGVVDLFTNNLSIFNAIEELVVSELPEPQEDGSAGALIAKATVVSLWRRTDPKVPENKHVRFRILGPNKKKIVEATQNLDLNIHLRGRLIANLPAIPVNGEGEYQIIIDIQSGDRWRKVGLLHYDIRVQPNNSETAPVPPSA